MPKVIEKLHSRPPLERMMRIHERIRDGKFPNSRSLAREVEASARTILRDIDFMMYRLEMPIAYDQKHYGYYYTAPVDHFPSLPMTEADLFALLVAHKAIAQYRGTPFEHLLETAFRKLTGQLDKRASFSVGNLDQAFSFRPFGPEDTDLALFQELLMAVGENRVVRFDYRKLGAKRFENRCVHPYHIACVDNRWYLFAFDTLREAMRAFVLTRMCRLRVTGGKFARRKDFKVDEFLRGAFSAYRGNVEDDVEVVVEFDAWATDVLRGRRWHWSQSTTELPGGQMRLRLRLSSIEEVERWILSWGTHATVIAPLGLADRIEQVAAELKERDAEFKRGAKAAARS
jgi:predicted DNA-binding transcriptional regulator YafY